MEAGPKPPHLCVTMAALLGHEPDIIDYGDRFRQYSIPYCGDSSIQGIEYCPWCGAKLPESLRAVWVSRIQSLGYEVLDPEIPARYRSGAWWREEAL
jgi:uncharacterized protein DUF6980